MYLFKVPFHSDFITLPRQLLKLQPYHTIFLQWCYLNKGLWFTWKRRDCLQSQLEYESRNTMLEIRNSELKCTSLIVGHLIWKRWAKLSKHLCFISALKFWFWDKAAASHHGRYNNRPEINMREQLPFQKWSVTIATFSRLSLRKGWGWRRIIKEQMNRHW